MASSLRLFEYSQVSGLAEDIAKVRVASSNPVIRSFKRKYPGQGAVDRVPVAKVHRSGPLGVVDGLPTDMEWPPSPDNGRMEWQSSTQLLIPTVS
jgi:hypothetical protein